MFKLCSFSKVLSILEELKPVIRIIMSSMKGAKRLADGNLENRGQVSEMIQVWRVDGELWTWREEEGVWLSALESGSRCLWSEPRFLCWSLSPQYLRWNVAIFGERALKEETKVK